MTVKQHEVQTLVDYCNENLGDKSLWIAPDGHPQSLAMCIIDSIYSTGSHYNSVINVLNRYTEKHGYEDGASTLLRSIQTAGGARDWAVML